MFPDLEFHHLHGFVAVARTGNFTKAAEELGLNQSSLSRSIQKLELQIGHPLFDRNPRQVTLTHVGQIFYRRALEILTLVENTFHEVCEAEEGGHIRLAAIPTIAPYFLPEILREFSTQFPKIKVSVTEEPSESIVKRCRQGEIDAAIIALPYAIENLDSIPLFEEELFLVLPAGHPLSTRAEISVQDIHDIPFVMLSAEHCLSDQIESFCRMESMQPIS
ncbi:MAG: LysR family transcriptional regulator, partial [Verrucomicrobiales bacterium]|nr:LysR family transcriptional regulator [Verrucomicrobiales bacterium]